MQLGFISDIHINYLDMPFTEVVQLFVDSIRKHQLTHLFFGGDIANDWQQSIQFVERLQEASQIPIYFIPGNHDYWNQAAVNQSGRDHINTWAIYDQFVQHPQSLLEKTLYLDEELIVVGHSAWYNHAYHGLQPDGTPFRPEQFDSGTYYGRSWKDKEYINWQMSDGDVSRLMACRVRDQLETVIQNYSGSDDSFNITGDFARRPDSRHYLFRENPSLRPVGSSPVIILMTHIVTHPNFCVPMPHPVFDYFNAFIGTDDLRSILHDYPIHYHFMGHVHYRGEGIDRNGITTVVNCLGYPREWRSQHIVQELEEALYILNINDN